MADNAVHERTGASTDVGASAEQTCARVVFGPKTRLGQTLISRAAARGVDTYAVARDDRDVAALGDISATVVTAQGDQVSLLADAAPASLRLFVCALGPVHPEAPQASDADNVVSDLGLIQRVLDSAPGAEAHVVLVSTVIALAPGDDRRYYGGWKNLVEEELRELLAQRTAPAQLSVLYPGRLMSEDERRRPWHRMHTSYTRLADIAEQAGQRPATSRVVGLDARAWLLARGASLSLRSISGSRGVLRRREAGPPPMVRDREAGQA
jgi:hypothetical protein